MAQVTLGAISIVMVLAGIALILHHGLTSGLWFDTNDLIGHDWLGLVMVYTGIIISFGSIVTMANQRLRRRR